MGIESSLANFETFLNFFIGKKVSSSRASITYFAHDPSILNPCSAVFNEFEPITMYFLDQIVGHVKASGSPSDAVYPQFFKEDFPSLGSTVLAVINSSLLSAVFPKMLKHAVVQPPTKKPALDPTTPATFDVTLNCLFIQRSLRR